MAHESFPIDVGIEKVRFARSTHCQSQRLGDIQFSEIGQMNGRNDMWFCTDLTDVLTLMHTKYTSSVMVLGLIIITHHFFSSDRRVDATNAYNGVRGTVVSPLIEIYL